MNESPSQVVLGHPATPRPLACPLQQNDRYAHYTYHCRRLADALYRPARLPCPHSDVRKADAAFRRLWDEESSSDTLHTSELHYRCVTHTPPHKTCLPPSRPGHSTPLTLTCSGSPTPPSSPLTTILAFTMPQYMPALACFPGQRCTPHLGSLTSSLGLSQPALCALWRLTGAHSQRQLHHLTTPPQCHLCLM